MPDFAFRVGIQALENRQAILQFSVERWLVRNVKHSRT